MLTPEYVNIFGIPFTFLPHESDESTAPKPPKPKTQVEALKDRSEYEITWPNILRIDRVYRPRLTADLEHIDPLILDAKDTRIRADLAPVIDGQTDLMNCTEIDLQKLDEDIRLQQIIFKTAAEAYELMESSWQSQGTKYALLGQVIRLVEEYLSLGQIQIEPKGWATTPVRERILYMNNMNRIVQHLWSFIQLEMTEKLVPILDTGKKIRSTSDMPTWFTSKPNKVTQHSQISHAVFDSSWEDTESYALEKNPDVAARAKNDHLGFTISYIYNGAVHSYLPDFLVKLSNGKILVLETKGQETQRDIAKRKALEEWIVAVNDTGDYGEWCNVVSYNPMDVDSIIAKQ